MIFVTVGFQLGFDRLISSMDKWAEEGSRPEILAQIGSGKYRPRNFPYVEYTDPTALEGYIRSADVVVSHAGMGTILTALRLKRRIVVMPRKLEFGEHRNDHQAATARVLAESGHIEVAETDEDLWSCLGKTGGEPRMTIGDFASGGLISTVREAIADTA